MAKISLAILTVVAFPHALWLVVFRRELPKPGRTHGLRRRFVLATLLFVGLLAQVGCGRRPFVSCYISASPPPADTQLTGPQKVAGAFQAVWRTLDPERGEEFRNALETAAGEGTIRPKVADMLAVAYMDLAYHKQRTRGGGPKTTCYKMTELGGTLVTARENALKQLELLEKARAAGTIDADTAAKARAALAHELEMLHRAEQADHRELKAQQRLVEQYRDGAVAPSDAATAAARLIVEMEGGPATDAGTIEEQ